MTIQRFHQFDDIISNNTAGSGELLALLMQRMKTNFAKKKLSKNGLPDVINHLQKPFSSFPVIQHFLSYMLAENTEQKDVVTLINQYENFWFDYSQKLIQTAVGSIIFPVNRIMVHSNSSTVVKFILELKKVKGHFSVLQTESRPAFEGRNQASLLLENDIAIDFFVDANMAQMMKNTDLLILGADVFTDAVFINKIGSLPMCLTAKYLNKPAWLIADPRKKVSELHSAYFKNYTSNEVWQNNHPNLQIHNLYFEATPLQLVEKKYS